MNLIGGMHRLGSKELTGARAVRRLACAVEFVILLEGPCLEQSICILSTILNCGESGGALVSSFIGGGSFVRNPQDVKHELCYAYVHAIASHTGYYCDWDPRDIKGRDVQITGNDPDDAYTPNPDPVLYVQLKGTTEKTHFFTNGRMKIRIPANQYNALRDPRGVSKILVVLLLPNDKTLWLKHCDQFLTSRICAYWCSLMGERPRKCKSKVTVEIRRKNVFSQENLKKIMKVIIADGAIPDEF